jgi:hypothetical protein
MKRNYSKAITYIAIICLVPLLTACNLDIKRTVKDLLSGEPRDAAVDERPVADQDTPTETPSDEGGTGFEKLDEILARGQSLVCTYTYEGETPDAEPLTGTIYTNGNDMFFTYTIPLGRQGDLNFNVLRKDDTLYNWVIGETNGTMMNLDVPDEDLPGVPEQLIGMEYSCEETEVDEGLFNVPDEVLFTAIPTSPPAPTTDMEEEDYCANCLLIEENSEKEACLEAFDCN